MTIIPIDGQNRSGEERTLRPCSICGGPIDVQGSWTHGHNAEPINSGRCCTACNSDVVIPARIRTIQERTK